MCVGGDVSKWLLYLIKHYISTFIAEFVLS